MSVEAAELPVAQLREEGRWRSLLDFYVTTMRTAVAEQLQYRVTNYFYMLGMIAEPVIQLVVWTTIANQHGGSVNGITASEFAAYYIVWTLVRNMNIVFGAPFWEWRIREGQLSGQLLRPMNILHYDLAYFAGWKFVVVGLWVPIAIGLSLVFHPDLHPTALEIVVFIFAIWGAYLIRSMFQGVLGMLNFWTTRGAAVATSRALQSALASLASYWCGFYFTSFFHGASASLGGLWSLISGLVVLSGCFKGETSWYLQLELKGLSSVGSGANSFLHGSIQGYSPP
jgi:ABC-type uncharacterized transport system permease subunit